MIIQLYFSSEPSDKVSFHGTNVVVCVPSGAAISKKYEND